MKKLLMFFISIFVLLNVIVLSISAMDFEKDYLNETDMNSFIKGKCITLVDDANIYDSVIKVFAVNGNHRIAIGFSNSRVLIFNDLGEFQYGISFINDGTSYALFWEADNLIIYFSRSNIAVELDAQGNAIEAYKLDENSSEVSLFLSSAYNQNKITVGEYTYTLSTTSFAERLILAGYTKCQKSSAKEIKTIFQTQHSSNKNNLIYNTIPIIFIMIALVCVIIIIRAIKAKKNSNRPYNPYKD